jgi:hypothetical protein
MKPDNRSTMSPTDTSNDAVREALIRERGARKQEREKAVDPLQTHAPPVFKHE